MPSRLPSCPRWHQTTPVRLEVLYCHGGTGLHRATLRSPDLSPAPCSSGAPARGRIYYVYDAVFTEPSLTIQQRRWEPPGPATQRDALRVQQEAPRLRPPETIHPGLPPRRSMSTYRV